MKLLYRGKAKSVYEVDADTVVMEFRDDITAGDGAKKKSIRGKGSLNAEISTEFFELLKEKGIRTHFIKFEEPNRHIAKKVKIMPLEVICRNIATGSLVRRYPFKEGQELRPPVIEMGYKSDEYHDPMLNDEIALALGAAKDKKELDEIRKITLRVNDILKKFLVAKGIILVDFKLEFGRNSKGNLLLADEISPDTCRFWDAKTKEIMDKDRFRKDLGSVLEFYEEVRRRILS
ncbi:MAG: phosphoribosylaminoimidazolesuccinocarboxamide synthase [Candidatus Hydrothermarchaeota archaeon]|nr:phosphoribosylaminoimidazolesuccinocarboxamide synthase [Candidatus Hydrothermarchaeota archaeon]